MHWRLGKVTKRDMEGGERERKKNKVEYGEWVLIWKHCKRLIRFVFFVVCFFFYFLFNPAKMSLSSVNNGFIIQMD